MFRSRKTITRPGRDRLLRVTRAAANTLTWEPFIDELERGIKRARIVEPARVSRDVVTMLSTVRIVDPTRDQPEVYTLVYPDAAAPKAGRLSVLSSVGTTLLGARTGDVLNVIGGTGPRAIKVESIVYQPEADQVQPRNLCQECAR